MAMSEKYCDLGLGDGAADGDGSSGDPWNFRGMIAGAAAGDRVNIKDSGGSGLTLTSNASLPAGSQTAPIIYRGYNSTIGDLSARGRTNVNGPLVTTNVPQFICASTYSFTVPTLAVIEDLQFTTARNGQTVAFGASYNGALRCTFLNTGTGGSAACASLSVTTYLVDCDAIMSGASGGLAAISGGSGCMVGCRVDGGPASCLSSAAAFVAVGCTFFGSPTDAVTQTSANSGMFVGCTFVGDGTESGDGLAIATGPGRLTGIFNCLFTDFAGYGINATDAATAVFAVNNRFDRNGGDTNNATEWLAAYAGTNNTTSATQANEYVDATGSPADFRLKSTSPALSIGLPLYRDIGALQRVRDYPAVGNVQSDDTVDGATGTLTLPAVEDVETGVQYGAGGTEFTGTLSGGSGGVFTTRQIGIGV